jgi:alpha-glucosidase
MMIIALRGTPFLYYGQELGLPDAKIPPDRVLDVDGRDPERSPMPWRRPSEAGPGAGFTAGEPWLPVAPEAEYVCVEAQQREPTSTLAFARELLRLRRDEPALRAGAQHVRDAAPDVFCFERELGQRFLVALNFSAESTPLGLTSDRDGEEDGGPGGSAVLELSTDPGRPAGHVDPRALVLEPDEGLILRLPAYRGSGAR